jgi:hypothetical protein
VNLWLIRPSYWLFLEDDWLVASSPSNYWREISILTQVPPNERSWTRILGCSGRLGRFLLA